MNRKIYAKKIIIWFRKNKGTNPRIKIDREKKDIPKNTAVRYFLQVNAFTRVRSNHQINWCVRFLFGYSSILNKRHYFLGRFLFEPLSLYQPCSQCKGLAKNTLKFETIRIINFCAHWNVLLSKCLAFTCIFGHDLNSWKMLYEFSRLRLHSI